MKNFLIIILVLAGFRASSQTSNVGIGTSSPNESAILDINSTTSGVLIPRMTTAQRTAIASPANGLLVYDTDTKSSWFRETTVWVELSPAVGLKSINGSSTFTTYNINPKRYMWELTPAVPIGTSIAIPQAIINDLCGDEDGCNVTITMTNWIGGYTESASRSTQLFYSIANGRWRIPSDISGIDGNNATDHILSLFETYFFTDAAYINFSSTDNAIGLNFLHWNGAGYSPSATGRLILED